MSIHVAHHRLLLPHGIPLSTTAQALNKVTEYNDRVYRHLESGSPIEEPSECGGVSLQASVPESLQYKRMGFGGHTDESLHQRHWGRGEGGFLPWSVSELFAMVCVGGGLEKQSKLENERVCCHAVAGYV